MEPGLCIDISLINVLYDIYIGGCFFAWDVYNGTDVPYGSDCSSDAVSGKMVQSSGPMNGTLNALIAETSGNIYRLKKVRMEGMMYSCSSFGVKLGGGIGSAVCGWLLEGGEFDGMASVQTQGALNMIQSMYVFIPVALSIVMAVLASMLNVEKANQKWDEEHRD